MKKWLLFLFLTTASLYGKSKQCDYGFLPPVTADSECGKLFTSLDLCLLRSASEGQVFGTLYIEGEDLDSIGEIKRLYYPTSYDFGFRLLGGYSLPGDQWAAQLTWFWYSSSQKANRNDEGFGSSRKGGSFFLPGLNAVALANNTTFPIATTGKWNLKINQLDGEASRDFLVGPAFTMRPSVGVRLLQFNEHVDTHGVVTSIPETDYLKSNLKGGFWGFGPLIGVDNFLDLGCGLGGFLSAKCALLVANHHQKQNLRAPFAIDPFDLSVVKFDNEMTGLKAALDFSVGLEWRMPLNRNLHFFFVRAAFENHLIFHAMEYPYVNSDRDFLPAYNREPHDFALFGFSLAFGFTI